MAPTAPGPVAVRPTSRPHRRAAGRTAALLVAAALVVGLSACGADGRDVATTTTTTPGTTTTDPDRPVPGPGEPDPGGTTSTTEVTPTTEPTTTTVVPGPGPVGPLPVLDPSAQVYADALAADLREGLPPGTDPECLATRWVDAIGIERLEAKDMTVEEFMDDGPAELDLDRESALAMADAMEPCGVTLEALIDDFGGVGTDLDCLRARVTEDDLRDFFAAGFMGEEPEEGPFPDAIEACTEDIEIEGSGPGS